MNKNIIIPIIIALVVIITLAIVIINKDNKETISENSSQNVKNNESTIVTNESKNNAVNDTIKKEESESMNQTTNIKAIINNNEYKVSLEENETVSKFLELLPQEFNMSELNGNEKYVNLDTTLPTNSYNPKHINAGDIMLYGNNCLVVFYKSFDTSYSYTKIGHIDNLKDLGNKDIIIEFEK